MEFSQEIRESLHLDYLSGRGEIYARSGVANAPTASPSYRFGIALALAVTVNDTESKVRTIWL